LKNNSEWIHVNILEAKIKGEQFYTTNFLLNTDFGSGIQPNSQMTKQELQDLSNALYYQLNERVSFVKPKERIVAQLLFDLGNIAFLLGNKSDASADYEQAKLYGYKGQLLEQRIQEAKHIKGQKQADKTNTETTSQNQVWLWALGIVSLLILTMIIYIRKRKNNS